MKEKDLELTNDNIADLIIKYRGELDLSRQGFANKMDNGASEAYIRKIENREVEISMKYIQKLLAVVGKKAIIVDINRQIDKEVNT